MGFQATSEGEEKEEGTICFPFFRMRLGQALGFLLCLDFCCAHSLLGPGVSSLEIYADSEDSRESSDTENTHSCSAPFSLGTTKQQKF